MATICIKYILELSKALNAFAGQLLSLRLA